MTLDPFLTRLAIGVLALVLFGYVFSILTFDEKAKQLLNVILVIVIVLWVLFGSVFVH